MRDDTKTSHVLSACCVLLCGLLTSTVLCASYLDTELQTHSCPVCYQLMAPPHKDPVLLFPCGHSFCAQCVDGHIAKGHNTCPFCRAQV